MAFCQLCQTYFLDNTAHVCYPKMVLEVPPPYEAWNDLIGVEPFKTDAVEKEIKGGFATAKQKVELKPLKVLFGSEKIKAGWMVYVRGDLCVEPDAKKVYEIDGVKVIFIKLTEVKLVKRYDTEALKTSFAFNANVPVGVGG